MTRHLLRLFVTLSVVLTTACANHNLQQQQAELPAFDLVKFFEGKTEAYGQFEDRFGKIRRRFTVDIDGSWDGSELTLVEDFKYSDGEVEQRIWKIRRDAGDNNWIGSADGVVGEARGQIRGNTMHWAYQFDLQTAPGKTLRVGFDDWLWLQAPNVLLNKAYLSKLGVNIGEVTIFFNRPAQSL